MSSSESATSTTSSARPSDRILQWLGQIRDRFDEEVEKVPEAEPAAVGHRLRAPPHERVEPQLFAGGDVQERELEEAGHLVGQFADAPLRFDEAIDLLALPHALPLQPLSLPLELEQLLERLRRVLAVGAQAFELLLRNAALLLALLDVRL
jgi:hypothetical protein